MMTNGLICQQKPNINDPHASESLIVPSRLFQSHSILLPTLPYPDTIIITALDLYHVGMRVY